MRKKIQELAEGKCERRGPILQFSQEQLELEVLEGENAIGEFSIQSINGIPMRGIIYTSNSRMECLDPEFHGTEAAVRYEFHSEGLLEGDSQKGDFFLICNEGEYDLPFTLSVTRRYPESSVGKIHSIFGFANLAQKSFEEAVEVFGQPEFEHLFQSAEEPEYLAYRTLMHRPCTRAQVEEFLIVAKKKERIHIQVEEAKREFYGVTGTEKHGIVLKKDHWGFTAVEISSDAPFLRPVKSVITTEDFVGNRAMAEYMIQAEALHPGKNFGRITFETTFQSFCVEVCVRREEKGWSREKTFLERQKLRRKLMEEYTEFRLHRLAAGLWAKQTCERLDVLCNLEPDSPWYPLYKVQVLLVNRQRQDAEWILKEHKRDGKKAEDEALYAYYLYLRTLYEPEPHYVDRLTREIKEIYHRNQENPLLLWILLFLDENLNHSSTRRMDVIRQQIARGCDSPLLYIEAYELLRKEPYQLKKAGVFERKILNWAARRDALTRELAEQIRRILPEIGSFHPVWYRILQRCYDMFPERELLQEICGSLIKWNCYGSAYFQWYDQAVLEELRITGVYEAWMLSADREKLDKIPKLVLIYFQFHNNLPYRQQVMLYVSVVQNKLQAKNVYQSYYKEIERFTLEQLRAGRIDQDMALLYREILTPAMMTADTAGWFSKALFTCRVTGIDERAARVVLRQYQLEQEQSVPVSGGCAYVNCYSSSYCVFLEDKRGVRYLPREEIRVEPLLDDAGYVKSGVECAPEKFPYLLKYFDSKKIWQAYEEEDLPYLHKLRESGQISRGYQKELRPRMIAYYYDNYTGDTLDAFLIGLSFEGLDRTVRSKLMELLVARGHYGKAYELVLAYGSESLSAGKMVSVLCSRIEEQQGEEDDFLVGMCRNVFLRGKYNDYMLRYLCRYFSGNLKEMVQLWQAAREFELETSELEERCLAQYLYTGAYAARMEEIFERYDRAGGWELLVLAYLSQAAHSYLITESPVGQYVFVRIRELMSEGTEVNEPCRLGYLKWCAQQGRLTREEEEQADRILARAVREKKYFPFYRKLPQKFAVKYMYYDLAFLEYRTDSRARVLLNYQPCGGGEYVECEMKQMYSGIFVKPFVLFFGEEIPYFIKEEQEGSYVLTQSGHIQNSELCTSAEGSGYDLLNNMSVSWQMNDEATLLEYLREYLWGRDMTEREFTIQ